MDNHFNSLNFSFIIEKLRINFVLLPSFQKLCTQQNVHARYQFFLRCHSVTQTQVWLRAAQKSIPEGQLLTERKVHISPECQQSGEKGRLMPPPKKQLQRFCSAMKVLKGKGKVISANRQDRASDWEPSPTACRLVSSSPSLFRCYPVHTVCSWDYWRGSLGRKLIIC